MDSDEFKKLIIIKSALTEWYTVNKKTFIDFQRDSLTPLQVAGMIDGVDMCRHFIEKGADFNVKCKELDATLMHCAALNEQHGLELIDYFSSLGLKLDAKDKFGDEPLQYAIKMNNSKVVQKLHSLNCPEEESNKNKPESRYHSSLAKMVMEQDKGLLNDFGVTGRSAIHLAAMLGDLDICKWLLNEGADVRSLTKNEYEDSVLHCAALNKSHGKELVQYFVSEHCFDVNAKDKLGFTPLHFALFKENIETVEELLQRGADIAVKRAANDSNDLENLMHCCVRWNKLKSAKFLQEKKRNLVKDLRTLCGYGYTSLHIATMNADLDMCKWLVDECGMDPHALARKQKLSILEYAACNMTHGKELITYFVKKHALDVNRKDEFGYTPLHQAFYVNNIVAAEELLNLLELN
ncbi:alpha-latrocrustotoxin-Lt1a-like [Cloeon dipterum]|uniref:alpha-latrocrustotoxin-Lt1a-like n=1 Tax=Cloeon dipterum TaxID=197152 RepID=UPI00321FBD01